MNDMEKAVKLMNERCFDMALPILENMIKQSPDNLSAWIRLAICRLIHEGEYAFISMQKEIEALYSRIETLGEEARKLWLEYKRICKAVTASALIIGSVSASKPADAKQMMVLYGVLPPNKTQEMEKEPAPVQPPKEKEQNNLSPIPPYGVARPYNYDETQPIDKAQPMMEYGVVPHQPIDETAPIGSVDEDIDSNRLPNNPIHFKPSEK